MLYIPNCRSRVNSHGGKDNKNGESVKRLSKKNIQGTPRKLTKNSREVSEGGIVITLTLSRKQLMETQLSEAGMRKN